MKKLIWLGCAVLVVGELAMAIVAGVACGVSDAIRGSSDDQ